MHFDLAPLLAGGLGAILLSAAARALPEPVTMGNPFYLWVYRLAHLLLANFDKIGWHNETEPSGS